MSQLPIITIPGLNPSVAISPQGEIFIAKRQGNHQIYLSMSFDNGVNWGKEIAVTNATSGQTPSIAFFGYRLFVAWTADDGSNILYYTFSDNNGQTFVPVVPINDALTIKGPTMIPGSSLAIRFESLGGEDRLVLVP